VRVAIEEENPVVVRIGDEVLQIYAPQDSGNCSHSLPWRSLGKAIEVPSRTDSDESYDFIRTCLKNCLSHEACNSLGSRVFPTRVLDIGKGEKDPIRLHIPRKYGFKYIALSMSLKCSNIPFDSLTFKGHCWGTGPTLTTTNSNLHHHQDEIELEHLPVLFSDTVRIARRLNVRYIWIDSLCILQDSKKDWEQESAKMGNIFENAHLVISAVNCSDSSQRILSPRPNYLRRRKLTYTNTTGKEFKLYVRKYHDHHPNIQENTPTLLTGPLTTRGWAQQEQILATRILHYTATELVFECKTAVYCECLPRISMRPSNPSLLAQIFLPSSSSVASRRKAYYKWHQLLNLYALRQLSYPCDKLPAISGIAEKFKMATGSVYVAGLWLDHLIPDLLWSSMPYLQNPHDAPRLRAYRAPSWSWASVDTQFQYEEVGERGMKSMVEVKSVNCELTGLNPLGEVGDGSLVLVGEIVEGTLIAPSTYDFYYRLKLRGPTSIEVSPDTLLVEDEGSRVGPMVRRAGEGETYKPFTVQVTCLAITLTSDDCVYGLVLSRSSRSKDAFERIGLFTCGKSAFGKGKKKMIRIV
jgi:hypothetical protein